MSNDDKPLPPGWVGPRPLIARKTEECHGVRDRLRVPRKDDDYRWSVPWWKRSGNATLLIFCGQHRSVLVHSVLPDGCVNPSVVCPHPGCAWHEFVSLKDWNVP
jgi:hypothetical protein